MNLNALLARQFNLPSIPKVVALLLNELDRNDVDLRKVNQ
ncbi:MAG: histidine kinase, partial [Rhodoferax sp.]|nr:histidine kinase [Rhodoferax sp.]